MADLFANYVPSLNSPASGVFTPSQSDTVDLTIATRFIRATGAGAVKVNCIDGTTMVCAFAAGETRAIRATRIWTTGTTATGIEGMY